MQKMQFLIKKSQQDPNKRNSKISEKNDLSIRISSVKKGAN